MSAASPPRRPKAEPIETSVKSSKESASPDPVVEPVDITTKAHCRFAPEPTEMASKTGRKFAPEPIETTARKSRTKDTQSSPLERRRRGSRDKFDEEWANEMTNKSPTSPKQVKKKVCSVGSRPFEMAKKRPPRKFAPLLIETARRTHKSGDVGAEPPLSRRAEERPGDESISPKSSRIRPVPHPPENTPVVDISSNPLVQEIKRATSPGVMRRPSWSSMRSHHSFRVPDLDPIESSESEGSAPPSPSTSPSATSDNSYMYKEATRMRESVDERFSGYLLELAAKAAEKQLRDQAMAAFPNDDHHEPVDHYIDHDSDETDATPSHVEQGLYRRESSLSEDNWEMMAMRKHREKLEQQQEAERAKNKLRQAAMNRPEGPTPGPWDNPASERLQKDPVLDRMRKDARPPMLGGDIRFPRCRSPEPSRFDPTQGCDAVRIAMCYLSEQSQAAEKGESLWYGAPSQSRNPSNRPSLYSNASSRSPSRAGCSGAGGLWGGFCTNSGQTPPRGPSGILTPRIDLDNPFSPCPTPAMSLFPPTPPASHPDFACIDEKLTAEASIEEDFGDDFVTQVYNYLSLGYPSVARTFDDELSKISRIPVTELRQDDHLATSRGYIRLGEDGNLQDSDVTEETCMRWRALRVYVKEWARQHPKMANDRSAGVGIAVRKGSWAI